MNGFTVGRAWLPSDAEESLLRAARADLALPRDRKVPPAADAVERAVEIMAALTAAKNQALDFEVVELDCIDELLACVRRLREARERRRMAVERLDRVVDLATSVEA